ncbi:transposase family protein [Actinoplanes sp. TBRC 11911]|uniref:transposase family protein n=1 Tax=Actinoplanes sp. TBRC 11911 TaxID=2729386 RepID=UPI00145FAC3A|nr:transposase family protein [Actinoplanes sp. TBRC 11911]NMO57301.1 transposase family protein [Actinoplanes sp. TBRC 11911]
MSFVNLAMLLPHLGSLRLQRVRLVGSGLRVEAATVSEQATCPGCGLVSDRVHSHYVRHLADTGVGGREVRLDLTVRRFFCAGVHCARRTFAEQVSQLTTRHGRRTVPAADVVQAVAVALGSASASVLVVGSSSDCPQESVQLGGTTRALLGRTRYPVMVVPRPAASRTPFW